MSRLARFLLVALTTSFILACGGGGGASIASTSTSTNVIANNAAVSGVAATGAAIPGGTITLKCASGSATTVTATDGSYSVSASGLKFPCIARVTKDGVQLHSLVNGTGVVNITPVTDLIVANITKGTAADAFDKFDANKTYSSSDVTTAISSVNNYLTKIGVDVGGHGQDPIGTKLVAKTATQTGNSADAVLDQVSMQLATNNKSLQAAAVELVVAAGGSASSLPKAQSISFVGPGNQTLGTSGQTLVANASSGLPVTLTSKTPTVCTVNGNTLTVLAVGDCTVSASQSGNASFTAAAPVSVTVKVSAVQQKNQTITFTAPASLSVGSPPIGLSATSSSGLPVTFSTSTPTVCTVSGNTLTAMGTGDCVVNASQAGDSSNAAATPVNATVKVNIRTQNLSFAAPADQYLGTSTVNLNATSDSSLAVSYISSTPSICSVSGNALTLISTGVCTVTASQAGNSTIAAAASVTRSFTVMPPLNSCPANVLLTWQIDSASCSAYSTAATNGSVVIIKDTGALNPTSTSSTTTQSQGDATFTCVNGKWSAPNMFSCTCVIPKTPQTTTSSPGGISIGTAGSSGASAFLNTPTCN